MTTTRDLGLFIRDMIDGCDVFHHEENEHGDLAQSDDPSECVSVDASDANNLVVTLDNGERFMVRIVSAPL